MDFNLPPEIEDLRLKVRAFIDKEVLPLEADPANFAEHENIPEERLKPVREKAKKAGLWAPQSVRSAGDQLHGAGRRQHEHAAPRRHQGAEG
jgi:acyl-CoA dehydrogenase